MREWKFPTKTNMEGFFEARSLGARQAIAGSSSGGNDSTVKARSSLTLKTREQGLEVGLLHDLRGGFGWRYKKCGGGEEKAEDRWPKDTESQCWTVPLSSATASVFHFGLRPKYSEGGDRSGFPHWQNRSNGKSGGEIGLLMIR